MKYLFIVFLFLFNSVSAEVMKSTNESDFLNLVSVCNQLVEDNQFKKLDKFLADNDKEISTNKNGFTITKMCLDENPNVKLSSSEFISEWQKQLPNSIYPYLANQLNLVDNFLSFYTGGKNSKENILKSYNYLNAGANELDFAKKLGVSPFWYEKRIEIAFYQNDKDLFPKYVAEGIRKYPNNVNVYIVASANFKPRWGYNNKNLNDFAVLSTNVSSLKEEVYTTIYRNFFLSQSVAENTSTMSSGYFDINAYRKGVYAILNRYPTQYNYNLYASSSCLLGDMFTAKDLINNRMNVHIKPLWVNNDINVCKSKFSQKNIAINSFQ